jgi:uncharacterized protein YbdZ (MbtH family)
MHGCCGNERRVALALGECCCSTRSLLLHGVVARSFGLWACLVCMAAVDMSRLPRGWRVVVALGKQKDPDSGEGGCDLAVICCGLWACLVCMAAVDMSRLPQGWRVVVALGKHCCCCCCCYVVLCGCGDHFHGLWSCLVCMAAVDMSRMLQGWWAAIAVGKQSAPDFRRVGIICLGSRYLVSVAAVDMSRLLQGWRVAVALGMDCVSLCKVPKLLRASLCRQHTHSGDACASYCCLSVGDVPVGSSSMILLLLLLAGPDRALL